MIKWTECSENRFTTLVAAESKQTSVFSEGGARVPNRGVVKFSQNRSLLKRREKKKHPVICVFLLFNLVSLP